jgi:hypothetical protein
MATKKRYELTPEHRAQLEPWRDKWIANAFNTAPYTDEEKARLVKAVHGLYAAANLPPPKHAVFVPSPFVLRFAGGFAAGVWWARKNPGSTATHAATDDATDDATRAATYAATHAATRDATDDATRAATYAATDDDLSRWFVVPGLDRMREIAATFGKSDFLLSCASSAWSMWNGGNQWSGWPAFLSFFRHVAKLELDYSKWDHYEVLATAGLRIMHADFCMISERPTSLTVDEQNRPHNATGPFCRWRDGASLYAIHGVRVPAWLIEEPERLTIAAIESEQNAEVKRVMIERHGLARYVRDAQFAVIDEDKDPLGLPRRLLQRDGMLVVHLINSTLDADGTRREYFVPCEPELRPLLPNGDVGEPQKLTALNAVAASYGMRGESYRLAVET